LYDPWHPAVLGLLRQAIAQARAAARPVSVCGEMAGDPAFTELLLAMGLRSFSMHPTCIASIKQRVLRADTRHLAAMLPDVLAADEPALAARDLLARAAQRALPASAPPASAPPPEAAPPPAAKAAPASDGMHAGVERAA
jgi:phosphotransferase system enzyme I (PtsI)